MSASRIRMLLTVAMIGLFWGLNWPAVKFILTEIPPLTIRACALTFAALTLGAFARISGHRLRPRLREVPWITLTGLLTIFGFNVLVVLGQVLTETAKAAIIAYTMPALTAVFSAFFLGERLRAPVILAVAIGTAGIAVLAAENLSELIARPLGPAIMLGSALSWALGTVALKAGRFTLHPLALTTWFLGVSAVACWPFALAFEALWALPRPSTGVLAVWIWHAFFPMVVCYAIWTRLVGTLPASIAAIATLMAPVVGVTSSMLLLGNPVTVHKVAALALILGSIVLTFIRPRRRPVSAPVAGSGAISRHPRT